MSRAVLLLLGGELRDSRAAKAAARGAVVICADGGARHAIELGLRPDFVVGDMDSAPKPPRAWKGKTAFWPDFDPNRSDLDKALDAARALKPARVLVAGARGGGLDHEMINFAALEAGAGGLDVTVLDGGTARLLGPGRRVLPLKRGARFSLLAAPSARLTLTGARYGLRAAPLRRGARGLGNRAEGRVVLTVHSGRVWVVSA